MAPDREQESVPQVGDAPEGNQDNTGARLEERVIELVNQRRSEGSTCGGELMPPVPSLSEDSRLSAAARAHSEDMAARNYFSHRSPEGEEPADRANSAGYGGGFGGENIAAGPFTAEDVMVLWMQSPGHCRNIMRPRFEEIGVGYGRSSNARYGHYWTQKFGSR